MNKPFTVITSLCCACATVLAQQPAALPPQPPAQGAPVTATPIVAQPQPQPAISTQTPGSAPRQVFPSSSVVAVPATAGADSKRDGATMTANTSVDTTGTWFKNMELNDFLALRAKRAGLQYFSNPNLDGKVVSGHLNSTSNGLDDIRAVAFQYGVTLYVKGSTLYALDATQSALLPRREFIYPLRYLRGETKEDQERLLDLIKPLLTERGVLRFEEKTNTLVIVDSDAGIASAHEVLSRVDTPKKQVVVEVKILRVNDTRNNRLGVDWSNTLGATGLNLNATVQGKINSLFAATPYVQTLAEHAAATAAGSSGSSGSSGSGTSGTTTGTGTTGSTSATATGATASPGVILDPIQVSAVLRALNDANIAHTENGPSVITEDNERAVFNVVDRVPIIEQTVSQTNGVNNISSDVRYKIDKGDNNNDPEKSREIGVSISVTPSILPDGTIRMKLTPRVATITNYVSVATGVAGITNQVPQVNEVRAESIARIPDGYSLLLGGYYQTQEAATDNKVPLLGDMPLFSFFFKSKQKQKTRANIAFLLTPTTYDPTSQLATVAQSLRVQQHQTRPKSLDYPDNDNPGENEKPDPAKRLRNIFPWGKPTPPPHPLIPETTPIPVRRAVPAGTPKPVKTKQERDEERMRAQLQD